MVKNLNILVLVALALVGCGRRSNPDLESSQPSASWKAEAEFSRGNDDPLEPGRETARIKVRLLIHAQANGAWEVWTEWVALNTSHSPMFPRGVLYILRLETQADIPDVAPILMVRRPGHPEALVSKIKLGDLAPELGEREWRATVELRSAAFSQARLIQQRLRFHVRRTQLGQPPVVAIEVRQANPGARYAMLPTPLRRVRAAATALFAASEVVAPYAAWPGDIAEPLPRTHPVAQAPLWRAARQGDGPALRAALAQGERLDHEDEDGQTALDVLYQHGHYDLLSELAGGQRDLLGLQTPLNRAVLANDHARLARLLREGANPNVPERAGYVVSPVELATRRGDLDSLRLLLAAGADVEAGTPTGGGPLDIALDLEREKAAELLLRHRQAPTWGVMTAAARGNLPMLKLFGQHTPTSLRESMPPTRETALMLAARFGHEHIVRYLLQHGANPMTKDVQGRTALDYARASGRPEVIRALDGSLADK